MTTEESKKPTLLDKLKYIGYVIVALATIAAATKSFFNTLRNEDNTNLSYRVFSAKLNNISNRLSYVEGRLGIEHEIVISQGQSQKQYHEAGMLPLLAIAPSFTSMHGDASTEVVADRIAIPAPPDEKQRILKALETLPDSLVEMKTLLESGE